MRAATVKRTRGPANSIEPAGDDQREIDAEPGPADLGEPDSGAVDPAAFAGDTSRDRPTDGPRKRGRPAGSRNRAKPGSAPAREKRQVQPSIDGLTEILLAIHGGISALTKIEAFEIDRDEAHQLAKATKRVADHYDIKPPIEALIWGQFATACIQIYGPRIAAVGLEMNERKRANRARRAGGDAHVDEALAFAAPA